MGNLKDEYGDLGLDDYGQESNVQDGSLIDGGQTLNLSKKPKVNTSAGTPVSEGSTQKVEDVK